MGTDRCVRSFRGDRLRGGIHGVFLAGEISRSDRDGATHDAARNFPGVGKGRTVRRWYEGSGGMSLAWHIARKDLIRLRLPLVLWAALIAAKLALGVMLVKGVGANVLAPMWSF